MVGSLQDSSRLRRTFGTYLNSTRLLAEHVVERLVTFCYHESLQRNTIEPVNRIIAASNNEARSRLPQEWADLKAEESKYIQIAGGFLFTTVATCVTWPSTDRAHWSASALFYMSMIFALVAIISSSQQLWILPRLDLGTLNSIHERQRRIDDVSAFVSRVQKTDGHGNLKARYVFALQAPIMLLTFSVLLFLAGLCSTVCSPLARKLEWNSDAKISFLFGIASIVALAVFASTSSFIYALFRPAEMIGS